MAHGSQAFYIGKTSRYLLSRNRDHLGIDKKGQPMGKSVGKVSVFIKSSTKIFARFPHLGNGSETRFNVALDYLKGACECSKNRFHTRGQLTHKNCAKPCIPLGKTLCFKEFHKELRFSWKNLATPIRKNEIPSVR